MSQSPGLGSAFRAMTLHRPDNPAAFGYGYGYGIQLMLHLVNYTGSCLTFGKACCSPALSQQNKVSFMNPSKPWNALKIFHSIAQDCGLVCITSLIAGIMAECRSGTSFVRHKI